MTSPFSAASTLIPQLRAELDGPVITPDDAGYDAARAVFYGKFDRRPAVILRPSDTAEVARVVSAVRDAGVALTVRSGGHSLAGHSVVDGAVLLDMANMRGLEIDPEAKTAWAETGLTAGEYTKAAGEHGLATGFGDTGSVGIGGLTLGGGVGFLLRKYGLTIDDLLAAEIVTADGQIHRVDAQSEPDLFWAIRGGGGNFGVATRFKYRLHEVDSIVGGLLTLPGTSDVIASVIAEADAAPEELSVIANVMVAPPMPFVPPEHHGRLLVLAMLCYAGSVEAGERAVEPFRKLATPIMDTVGPMPYPQIYQLLGEPPRVVEEVTRSIFVDAVDGQIAEAVVSNLQASVAPMAVAQLRALGGAMARVPEDATAFAHRGRRFMISLGAVYEHSDETPAHEAWASDFAGALRNGDAGIYVNFLGNEGDKRVRDAYPGRTWDRLAAIKNRYDPTNLFRHNHNIPPATSPR
ncbi:MAG TPA: FAD-binding oxidoreductase [Polyangiaceae bacterium]|nr:FAD-binding oxidoreductase [Polyangiaceae bacterium]